MKTAAFQTRPRKSDLGTSPRKSGSILPWVSLRFRQLTLTMPLRHAEHPLWEAHSARKRDALIASGTQSAAPSASHSLARANHLCNCALPYEFSPQEKRALTHTTP